MTPKLKRSARGSAGGDSTVLPLVVPAIVRRSLNCGQSNCGQSKARMMGCCLNDCGTLYGDEVARGEWVAMRVALKA